MRRSPGLEIRSAFGAGTVDFSGAIGARACCRYKAKSAARSLGCLTPDASFASLDLMSRGQSDGMAITRPNGMRPELSSRRLDTKAGWRQT
jgi:hypothetical protein